MRVCNRLHQNTRAPAGGQGPRGNMGDTHHHRWGTTAQVCGREARPGGLVACQDVSTASRVACPSPLSQEGALASPCVKRERRPARSLAPQASLTFCGWYWGGGLSPDAPPSQQIWVAGRGCHPARLFPWKRTAFGVSWGYTAFTWPCGDGSHSPICGGLTPCVSRRQSTAPLQEAEAKSAQPSPSSWADGQ